MSENGFCTRCGAARAAGANFCTSCGTPFGGAARPVAAPAPASRPVATTNAIAAGALLLVLGGAAAYFALGRTSDVARAVPGTPGGGAPGGGMAGGAPAGEGGLPSGHPSIELPKEVVDFLDGLTKEAEKDPKNVEVATKLARARYRASVINAAYRAPAQQALENLLALDPSNQEALRIAANIAYDSDDYAEAEKRFHALLDKYPGDPSAITDMGSAQLFQGKTETAIATYHEAIAKDPKFMQAHFNLGIALEKQGKKDDAVGELKKAMDLAESPDERQHIENALAELEGRAPQQIAGARGEAPAQGAMPPAGMPGGAPGGTQGGMPPGGMGGGGMAGGMPMPPPAPERDVPSNASSEFQKEVQKPLVTHPIVGPRIASFDWTGPAAVTVKIADFPMDKMPPFARAKFKSGIADRVAAAAKANGVAGPVTMQIEDAASGSVMETIDTSKDASGGAQ